MKSKKIVLFLILAVFIAGGVFAQESDVNSYAPGLEDNNIFINAGIGFGRTYEYKMSIPPISASVDVKLPIDLPITLGGTVIFTTWNWDVFTVKARLTAIGFGARGMYHLNLVENLDVYGGVLLGAWLLRSKVESNFLGSSYSDTETDLDFLWGINIGARYFFTDTIGAYVEVGYNDLQFVSVGLSLKF